MKASLRLGSIAGIEIGVHYTWLLALVLITWTIAEGFFPAQYPGWSGPAYWAAGLVAALSLFGSVLVHELAHSFVARGRGLPIEGITLFMFGGVSTLRGEAQRPADEFAIAIVGPLTSLLLAGVFWTLYVAVSGAGGPLEGILRYLAIVNGLLAVFNLLPGFPLDGGRVLRSVLWASTGSLVRATNLAAGAGQVLGWAMIAWGVFLVLQGAILSGLWVAFIGWFLSGAADSARKEVASQEVFRDVRVRDVMEPRPVCVSPRLSVDDLVGEYFLRRGLRAVPVCDDGDALVGIVTLTDMKGLTQEVWRSTAVSEIMTRAPLHQVTPEADLTQALQVMGERDVNQVVVCQGDVLMGMLARSHVIRYLQRVQELGLGGMRGARHAGRRRWR